MGPLCPDEYGAFLGRQTTHAVFFQSQDNVIGERFAKLKIVSPAAMAKLTMAKLVIDHASVPVVSCKKKSGDFHYKSGYREIFIILSKIGRSLAKSGDLEALDPWFILPTPTTVDCTPTESIVPKVFFFPPNIDLMGTYENFDNDDR